MRSDNKELIAEGRAARVMGIPEDPILTLHTRLADALEQVTAERDKAEAELAAVVIAGAKAVTELEYGVIFPAFRNEPSFIGVEDSARYFMGRPAASLDAYAKDDDERALVRRRKAGPWLPLAQEGGDRG